MSQKRVRGLPGNLSFSSAESYALQIIQLRLHLLEASVGGLVFLYAGLNQV